MVCYALARVLACCCCVCMSGGRRAPVSAQRWRPAVPGVHPAAEVAEGRGFGVPQWRDGGRGVGCMKVLTKRLALSTEPWSKRVGGAVAERASMVMSRCGGSREGEVCRGMKIYMNRGDQDRCTRAEEWTGIARCRRPRVFDVQVPRASESEVCGSGLANSKLKVGAVVCNPLCSPEPAVVLLVAR